MNQTMKMAALLLLSTGLTMSCNRSPSSVQTSAENSAQDPAQKSAQNLAQTSAQAQIPTQTAQLQDGAMVSDSPDLAEPGAALQNAAAITDRVQLAESIEQHGDLDIGAIDQELIRIRQELIIDRYFENLYEQSVDELAIETYYREHADEFAARRMQLAHIFLRQSASASEEERLALLTKAQDITARLHAGDEFITLAKQFSEDAATASSGGELGWVDEQDLAEDVISAALPLEAGAISSPVVTHYGIHILKKLAPTQDYQRPLAEVQARISHTLRAQIKSDALTQMAQAE